MPKTVYSLSKDQRKLICEWVQNFKLPHRYASNLGNFVDINDCKIPRMKSHGCHVFLERLMPIAFKGLLPKLFGMP